MKQKLLLSMYHVSDVTYWILDEPTLALDLGSVHILREYLLTKKAEGKCILFSAHEDTAFYEICDNKYTIDFGVFKKL
ncbi:hypothetical protein A5886_000955 [Enterococcus sp. 8G7_MSG3316]|uniref:ABC transporter domain-containing protein n=1 Tax=Candidatus Enterococcus testudinis TaxID=1834191 RepID=A0A242A4N6_9ENTE|nr:hypothetical protein [Enterococcus sp. 8G7_MSG3316]OTN75879.1 hypothetical protein A5886_000955 [Enterococcus sp. 8G7_MSG3316]